MSESVAIFAAIMAGAAASFMFSGAPAPRTMRRRIMRAVRAMLKGGQP